MHTSLECFVNPGVVDQIETNAQEAACKLMPQPLQLAVEIVSYRLTNK